ncbi:MAG: FtsX-like permease family protein, partial [Caldilinea sp.]
VVRRSGEDGSLLSNLKVVEADWPFYGEAVLASGASLREVLQPGRVVVEQALLDRLGVQVGDMLRVGDTMLTIADVVLSEPDRPVEFFALGPRVLVAAADLEALNLVNPGSRVTYRWLLKAADPGTVNAIAAEVRAAADRNFVRVDTYRTARTGIERFFTNFLFFLSLVGIFTLLLAGIGIQSSLTAFLHERHGTIAIAKTLGASSRFVTLNFYVVVLALGAVGAALGIVLGFVLQWTLPSLLRGFLPPDIELVISARAVVESALLGVVVVLLFTFLPLHRLQGLRPSFIFRKDEPPIVNRVPFALTILLILGLFTGMVIWRLGDMRTALWFVGGALVLLLIAWLLTEAALWLLRRWEVRWLPGRQALRGLFRPRNGTRAIVITLSTALGVLFCIFVIEQNLRASFVQSYPPDAPNVFFLDIQPEQVNVFAEALGMQAEFVPTVRAALTAVNGAEPRRNSESEGGRNESENVAPEENAGRRAPQYTLTYRDQLVEGEMLVEGSALFDGGAGANAVSVLQETADMRGIVVGDTLTFNVQGVLLDATVTSIRRQAAESVQPFFGFVFAPPVLAGAPQTIFTGVRVPPDEIAALQNRIVAQFPNITVIDVTATIAQFAAVVDRITQVVRFFSAFSILAGLLIVVSSVYATRLARVQEAAYYKVLGAKRNWVTGVFALENVLLGLLSGTLALLMAQVAAWAIMTWLFELDYQFLSGASVAMVAITIAAVTAVGMVASIGILRSRPIAFLRLQTENE